MASSSGKCQANAVELHFCSRSMERHRPLTLWLACLALVMLASLATTAPAAALEVILLRHADKDVARGDFNLSPQGFQRALGLARLIPGCFGNPGVIISFFFDPLSGKNSRSYQSAVPLAVATGTPIQIAMDSPGASQRIGEEIRRGRYGDNQRLVLFWEHRRMPALALGLGWPGMQPIADDDFDRLFVFRYAAAGAVPEVQTVRQSQLFQLPCFRNTALPWEHLQPSASPSRR